MPDNVPGNAARVLCRACADYEQAQVDAAVEAVFAFCQNAGRLGPHSRVLLKPNLLAKHPPERAVTTHPAAHGRRAACAPFMSRDECPQYAKMRARRSAHKAKRACAKRRASACARSS